MTMPVVPLAVAVLAWFAIRPRKAPWKSYRYLGPTEIPHGRCRSRSVVNDATTHDDSPRRQRSEDVPVVADLLAVAVSAGVPIQQALIEAASVLRTRAGASPVVEGGDRLARGVDIPVVLDAMARRGVGWHALATQLSLSLDSGASVDGTLRRLAAQERLRIRRDRERRARRLPVLLLLPLTTMVLPAFVLVTVVPFIVAGGMSLELPQSHPSETGEP